MKSNRLIFTFTTGRSGTMLLKELLSICPDKGLGVYHEPEPSFQEAWYNSKNVKDRKDYIQKFILEEKLEAISKLNHDIYIETSHVFSKWFIHIFTELGIDFDLIFLARNTKDIVKSMYDLNDIPGVTSTGKDWYLNPFSKENVYIANREWTNYQLCYWYVLETLAREKIFKESENKVEKNIKMFDVTLNELCQWDSYSKFIISLGLSLPNKNDYYRVTDTKWNAKERRKSDGNILPDNTDEQEKQVREYLSII